jgi:hypothetical protein
MTEEIHNSTGFYRALLASNSSGLNLNQSSYNALGLIICSTANFAMGQYPPCSYLTKQLIPDTLPTFSLVLDFHLDGKRAKDKICLSTDYTPEASRRLDGYAPEALRLPSDDFTSLLSPFSESFPIYRHLTFSEKRRPM